MERSDCKRPEKRERFGIEGLGGVEDWDGGDQKAERG